MILKVLEDRYCAASRYLRVIRISNFLIRLELVGDLKITIGGDGMVILCKRAVIGTILFFLSLGVTDARAQKAQSQVSPQMKEKWDSAYSGAKRAHQDARPSNVKK